MIRRSRISVRPNVRPTGRVPQTSRDASQDNPQIAQAPADLPSDAGDSSGGNEIRPPTSAPTVEPNQNNSNAETPSSGLVTQTESSGPAGDAVAQTTATSSVSTSGPQRRKRFTVLPNLAKPRTSSAPTPAPTHTSSRTPKSPVKATVSTESTAPAPTPQTDSRGKRRPSGGARQPKSQPKPTVPLQASLETSSASQKQDHGVMEKTSLSASQSTEFSCLPEEIQSEPAAATENPPPPEPQLALAETETVLRTVQEQNDGVSPEKAQSSSQQEKTQSHTTSHLPLTLKTLKDPMDRIRLAKAKKLRELLKKEMNKDKQKEKPQRSKMGHKELKTVKDHTKMTMRELIYYLPTTNPMKSYAEDEQRSTETVIPSSPKAAPAVTPPVPEERVEDGGEEEEETPEGGTREEEPLLAPRVKVAEDGSLIIDEESLTVEVLRVKGPNPAEERDPIFERGSTTTYSSFRKGTYTKPWSNRETDMFFLAISMVGTDFSMIGQLFPHRARIEIKNKFKKEERANSWRIDKAFKERRRLDLDFFNELLEKILKDEEKKRQKKKDAPRPPRVSRNPRSRETARRKKVLSSSCPEEEGSGTDVMEGEKENAENNTAVEQSPVDRLQEPYLAVENSSEIKPTQLKGRAPKHVPNILRRWRNKVPAVPKKAQEKHASDGEESLKDKASKVSSASAAEKEKKSSSDIIYCELEDSEEEEEPDLTAVQEHILNKPTRSGRIPKLSQHVIRAVADEDEEQEQLPSSAPPAEAQGSSVSSRRVRKKPGPSLKQGMLRRGKSRLVTLLASATEEEEDDEEDFQDEDEDPSNTEEVENQAFVPMVLRCQPLVHTEVEETMEEDVIEFLAPEQMEVSEESYAEAARTLLTIGHSAQIISEAETPSAGEEVIIVEESSRFMQQNVQQEVILETTDPSEVVGDHFQVVTSDFSVVSESKNGLNSTSVCQDNPEQVSSTAVVAPQPSQHDFSSVKQPVDSQETKVLPENSSSETSNIKTSQKTASQMLRNRLKPTPNLGRAFRPPRPLQKQTSPVKVSEDAAKGSPQTVEFLEQEMSEKVEENDSVLSAEKKLEDEVSKVEVSKEEENVEAREKRLQLQQPHSGNESTASSSASQSSEQSSDSIRRWHGRRHKPKPNLVQNSRTAKTDTQLKPAQPKTAPSVKPDSGNFSTEAYTHPHKTEESANVITEPDISQSQVQQETERSDSLKDSSATREEKNEDGEEDVFESLSIEVISTDLVLDPVSASEEPVFILALSEVPSTFAQEQLSANSELQSELASASTPDVEGPAAAKHQISNRTFLPDILVPVSEVEEMEVDKTEEAKESSSEIDEGNEEAGLSQVNKREYSLITQENPVVEDSAGKYGETSLNSEADGSIEEMDNTAKRRKLPVGGRRAKLKIKPNPVRRRGPPAKQLSPLPSSEEASSAPAPSQQTIPMSQEETATLTTSLTDTSSTSAIPEDDLASAVLGERTKVSPTSPTDPPSDTSQFSSDQTSVPTASQSACIEAISTQDLAPERSSEDAVGQESLSEGRLKESVSTENSEASGSGAESQSVHQITSLATTTTGPLTRPGRRPRGFLSFMSSSSMQGPSSSKVQKPAVNKSRSERRRAAPGPLTSASRTASATQKPSKETSTPPADTLPTASPDPASQANAMPDTSCTSSNADEEPTSVSAYFFSDIFTMVEEQEEME